MKRLNTPETFYSNTAVHLAIIKSSKEVLECLLNYNIDIDQPNHRGWTAREYLQKMIPFKISQGRILEYDKINNIVKNYIMNS